MGVAAHLVRTHVLHRRRDEPSPEAVVELGKARIGDDERPERAGGGDDDGTVRADALESHLEGELADRVAEALEPRTDVVRRRHARGGRERRAEAGADLAEPGPRDGLGQQADELGVATLRKLDRGRLRRRRVHLRRPPRTRPTAPCRALEVGGEQAGSAQALESSTRDVPMDTCRRGDLADARRATTTADVEKCLPQPGIADGAQRVHLLHCSIVPPDGF